MGIAAGALLAGGGAAAAGATTAGVVGAGVAGASIASSREAAKASRKAGSTQAAATDRATAETRRQFERTREDLAPYRQAGIEALTGRTEDPRQARLNELKSSLDDMSSSIEQVESGQGGIAGTVSQATKPELQRKRQELQSEIDSLQSDIEQNPFQTGSGPGLVDLVTDPETQRDFITENPFFSALAEDAQSRIFQNKAARGKVGSGETAEALQNSLLLLGSDLLNQNISQRQNLVNTGQSAAAQTGQFGAQAAESIADLQTSGAAAKAAGTVGAANVQNQTFQGLLNAGATYAGETGLSLSDRRHKTDIKKLGEDEHGLGVYSYKFKGDDKTRVGHMAQEVGRKFPKAVKTIADLKLIDYSEMEASHGD